MKYISYFENKGVVHIKTTDDDGKRRWLHEKKPAPFYRKTEEETPYRSIYGDYLEKFEFDTLSDAKKFLYEFPETKRSLFGTSRLPFGIVSGMEWEEAFIDDFNVCVLDIETEVDQSTGVPDPILAIEPVNMITLKVMTAEKFTVMTTCKVDIEEVSQRCRVPVDLINLRFFESEDDMLNAFVDYFSKNDIDIYGGWNSEDFDMTYMGSRIEKRLGFDVLLRMSPFGQIDKRSFKTSYGNDAVEYKIRGMYHIDFMKLYKTRVSKFEARERHSLDYIANFELGEGKLVHESGIPGHLLYKTYPSAGLAYNVVDVKRVEEIIKSRRILDLNISLAQMCRMNLDDIEFVTRIVMSYTYNYLKKVDEFMPLETPTIMPRKYEGGFVYPTIKGRHKYMFTCDIAASYPSSMRAINISPESKTRKLTTNVREMIDGVSPEFDRENETMAPNGQCFDRHNRGMFPRILDELAAHRQKFKDEKNRLTALYSAECDEEKKALLKKQMEVYKSSDKAVKEINNSVYGSTGSSTFIFYDPDIAEAITMTGQIIQRWMCEAITEFVNNPKNQLNAIRMYEKKFLKRKSIDTLKPAKCRLVAGDTDSVMFEIEQIVSQLDMSEYERLCFIRWFADTIVQKVINIAMEKVGKATNAVDSSVLKADREIVSPAAIFTAKKKYSMLKFDEEGAEYHEPYPQKTQGLTIIQKSTPKVVKDKLVEFMTKIFYSDEEAYDFECSFRADFDLMPPDSIARNTGVSDVSKYEVQEGFMKGTPLHVRGSIAHNRLALETKADVSLIKNGSSIKYVYLSKPNPVGSNVISWCDEWPSFFDEVDLSKFIDHKRQFEAVFSGQTHILFSATGYNFTQKEQLDLF